MIHLAYPQGTPAWHEARLGIPTSSNFHRIITPKTRKPSAQVNAPGFQRRNSSERCPDLRHSARKSYHGALASPPR